jgi:hypothetical protein
MEKDPCAAGLFLSFSVLSSGNNKKCDEQKKISKKEESGKMNRNIFMKPV